MTLWLVFVTSLLGSIHCAAMCGGLAAACTGLNPGSPVRAQVTFHLTRGTAYIALGAIAGAVGATLELSAATMIGVQRLSGLLAGTLLVGMAVVPWLPRRSALVQLRPSAAPQPTFKNFRGPFGLGIATAGLPCGWLWAYLATAAASSHPALGVATMAAFWLGTVPALVVVATGARWFSSRFLDGWPWPWMRSAIFLLLGLAALAGKLGGGAPSTLTADNDAATTKACHAER